MVNSLESPCFKALKQLTPQKIVWHLKHNEIVFLVGKNLENGKYIIASYRLKVIRRKERIVIWTDNHMEHISQNAGRMVINQASDYREWSDLLREGYSNTQSPYFEGSPTEYFKFEMFDDEKYTFPKNVEFYGYVSDKISRFGKGIEEEFAEYWFTERCNIDDSDKS